MSIESDLSSIASSLSIIASYITQTPKAQNVSSIPQAVHAVPAPSVPVGVVQAPIVEVTPLPNVVSAPVSVPVAPAPVAPPTVVAATPSPVSGAITKEAFTEAVMTAYKALGPVKGNQIQDLFAASGFSKINEINPSLYADLLTKINAMA